MATLPGSGRLGAGASASLESLLRQWRWLQTEVERLDAQVLALSQTPRGAPVVAALRRHQGVGVLTAMVFLTELGDLSRFSNRRQVGSFLGLTPSSFETGEGSDRKGHSTRQGPVGKGDILLFPCGASLVMVQCGRWHRRAGRLPGRQTAGTGEK